MGRAIVRQPQVFLFDEPLSNLDAKLRAQTRLEIQKLHRELGITSLFVTHDQVEAMTLAQRMIVMNAGRMEQIGTPEEVYARPATTFVAGFIGSPPMNLLHGQADGARFTRRRPDAAAAGGRRRARRADRWACGPSTPRCGADGGGWPLQVDDGRDARRRAAGLRPPRRRRCSPCASTPRWRRRSPATRVPLRVAAEHLHWFDASTGQRDRMNARLALPAVDRPPRRRQAGAGEHAGRLPPRRAHGYRAFECDVKLSADGVPFLLHDATLRAHHAARRGLAGERRWAELSRLDAGSWHSRAYAGEPLPSLDAWPPSCSATASR